MCQSISVTLLSLYARPKMTTQCNIIQPYLFGPDTCVRPMRIVSSSEAIIADDGADCKKRILCSPGGVVILLLLLLLLLPAPDTSIRTPIQLQIGVFRPSPRAEIPNTGHDAGMLRNGGGLYNVSNTWSHKQAVSPRVSHRGLLSENVVIECCTFQQGQLCFLALDCFLDSSDFFYVRDAQKRKESGWW